ncbi:hypothetical protein V1477_008286 [Vespula maculifrons]|uniref:Uncharacterized protein n=1 Tax=Vespula maculifrons TaxID=7453 RepID=A0ABD2CCM2_VESMC
MARFSVPPLLASCDPDTNLDLWRKFPRAPEFNFSNRRESRTYLEVARFSVPLFLASCDPDTNLDLWRKFPRAPEFDFSNKRVELTWRWHDSAFFI